MPISALSYFSSAPSFILLRPARVSDVKITIPATVATESTAVTNARNVKRNKSFAGRERQECEQAKDRGTIGRSARLVLMLMPMLVLVHVPMPVLALLLMQMLVRIMKMHVAFSQDLTRKVIETKQEKGSASDPGEPFSNAATQCRTK